MLPQTETDMTLKVAIWPEFNTPDNGDGGVRRVVEAQHKYLPAVGVAVVSDPDEADVIASHILFPKEYLRRFADKPLVAMCHGLYWSEYVNEDGSSMWPNWCHQTNRDVLNAILAADITTGPSEWVSQCIRRHTCRDVRTVYHGVDLAEWDPVPSGGYVLANKTRVDPVCDPTPIMELARMMPEQQFRTTVVMGRPSSNLAVTGKLPYEQAKDEVRAAAVYLCTTRETFGIGTLEALAAGVPVVGWRWGGQEEIIDDGDDGMLVTPGDFPALVEAVRWGLAHRDDPRVRAACRAKAARFTWEDAARRYAEIFQEAAHRRRPGRPRVSIVVPAFNMEPYLADALDSVRDQTIRAEIECVVVDDGSSDGTAAIADAYASREPETFRVVRLPANQGVSAARNAGIAQARGGYVMQLDADDRLTPEASAILASALDADRTVHVAYGGVEFRDETLTRPLDYGQGRPGYSGWPTDFRFDEQLAPPAGSMTRPKNLIPYNAMVRRDALDLVGRYRFRRRNAEDPDLWCRLASYGFTPKMVTAAPLLQYRTREGSLSTSMPVDDWSRWFPWSRMPKTTPAGALRGAEVAVPSLMPVAVAVIIPVGPGHERLVQDAVDSVDCQTMRFFECIVVNDTGADLPPLPSWVQIIETEGRRGPAHCRNLALAQAQGETFLCLDADDYLEPHALRVMLDAYLATGRVIYSDFWEDPDEPGRFKRYQTLEWEPRNLWEKGLVGGAVTQLMPMAAYRATGGFDESESLMGWEDWDFHLRVCAAGFCSQRVAVPLWTYRKHAGARREAAEAARDLPGGPKEWIVRKYPALFPTTAQTMGIVHHTPTEEEANIMAGCRSCGGGGRAAMGGQGAMNGASQQNIPIPQGAGGTVLLVEYIAPHQGGREFRANSQAVYTFSAGDPPSYVHPEDVEYFQRFPDLFRLLQAVPAEEGQPDPSQPVVQAQGVPLEVEAPLVMATAAPPKPPPPVVPAAAVDDDGNAPPGQLASEVTDANLERLGQARQRATRRNRTPAAPPPAPEAAEPEPTPILQSSLGTFAAVTGAEEPSLSDAPENRASEDGEA